MASITMNSWFDSWCGQEIFLLSEASRSSQGHTGKVRSKQPFCENVSRGFQKLWDSEFCHYEL